jgi:glucose-1-phosphate thymidylyltransferase
MLAVTGLSLYHDNDVVMARDLKSSVRGELEITDLLSRYLTREICAEILGRHGGFDTGTHDSLQASHFIQLSRSDRADRLPRGGGAWGTSMQGLEALAQPLLKSGYGEYLLTVLRQGKAWRRQP